MYTGLPKCKCSRAIEDLLPSSSFVTRHIIMWPFATVYSSMNIYTCVIFIFRVSTLTIRRRPGDLKTHIELWKLTRKRYFLACLFGVLNTVPILMPDWSVLFDAYSCLCIVWMTVWTIERAQPVSNQRTRGLVVGYPGSLLAAAGGIQMATIPPTFVLFCSVFGSAHWKPNSG